MTITRIYVLPVLIFVLMPSTYLITYMVAVSLGHVEPGFPYISDTGTFSPESCLFSQLTNIAALLFYLFAWVRYGQVNILCNGQVSQAFVISLNKLGYWCGVTVAVGTSIVANFQETNLIVMHLLGALLCFAPAMAYVWMQTFISFKTSPTTRIVCLRLTMAIIGSGSFFVCITTAPLAILYFHGKDVTKWKPEDGGYVFHMMSTITEWILVIGFCIFILTFSREFQEIVIEPPEINILMEVNDSLSQQGEEQTSNADLPPEVYMYQPVVVQTQPFRELLA